MYIISAYAAVGMIKIISVNIWVATKTASVPFCKPHSIVMHYFCLTPEASNWATKYATNIITTLSTKVIKPACAK